MKKRSSISKNSILRAIFSACFLLALFILSLYFAKNDMSAPKRTPVYELGIHYAQSGDYELPSTFKYDTSSPEGLFAKGFKLYLDGDIESAYGIFKQVESSLNQSVDVALPFYLYCYLNECELSLQGVENQAYIEKAVNYAKEYPPAASDHFHLWQAVFSMAQGGESDVIAIGYLEDILENDEYLSFDAKIRYNNCIAMLDFFDGNYAKSIRRFYDVREMYKGVELSKFLTDQMLFTNSYIALFYYEFDDYNNAIEQFEANIAVPVDDPYINAKRKYSDYINLSSVYIDLKDYDNAIRLCKEMEEIVPYLSDDLKDSIHASIYDNYARVEIEMGNFDKAREYIAKQEELLAVSKFDAFAGSTEFLDLTKCKLEFALENYKDIIPVLEGMIDDGSAEFAGITDEVLNLLLKAYEKTGDKENYYHTIQRLRDSEDEFLSTIKREYLEFSQYYSTSKALTKENESLYNKNRISDYILIFMILALAGLIIAALLIARSNYIDALTGVRNRKALHKYAKKHEKNGILQNTNFIMLDIDYFKLYNDTYGHLNGDVALKSVATAIKKSMRKDDFIIRYGGEEFLIILEHLDPISAEKISNRIIENVSNINIPHKSSQVSDHITVSLGLCVNNVPGANLEELLHCADQALYDAKKGGRNRLNIIEFNS